MTAEIMMGLGAKSQAKSATRWVSTTLFSVLSSGF